MDTICNVTDYLNSDSLSLQHNCFQQLKTQAIRNDTFSFLIVPSYKEEYSSHVPCSMEERWVDLYCHFYIDIFIAYHN